MKNGVVKYERVYEILKNKIICGLLSPGTTLPGRANLCREFDTSERTVRRAVEMLEQEGFLEVVPKKRPVVAADYMNRWQEGKEERKQVDAVAANDILKSGILLCYPVNRRGMFLCKGDDWKIPETIVENMDVDDPIGFWRLSNRLWRFFISRNENELALRAVDSLGLGEVDPLPAARKNRVDYLEGLKKLIETVKCGGRPEEVHFDALFSIYGIVLDRIEGEPVCRVTPDSPLRVGTKNFERQFRKSQERYSSVYLDILGQISIGRCQPGDRLPTHEELQKIYGVSIDTTIKAIRILQDWGVVTASPRNGIFVAKDLEGLQKICIEPEQIASHVRRYFDSLELVAMTVEGVAEHAAENASPDDARRLWSVMNSQWNDPFYHQLIPLTLLEFIADHIHYNALKAVYDLLLKNYSIGRGIPKLVQKDKTPVNSELYRQCMEVTRMLAKGDKKLFAAHASAVFQKIHWLVIQECKRLGYWDSAMNVYDGTALWK
ncbi:GntR family transcriptional regulator [Hungatella sp. L12]|uniref:GntR family transcriptional regulator n=1 Tax=Hungatella hominis TaxID=2763050 RepID=A0ABR7H0C9_9FIRM|nr:GntR family transcriptional regulator [Hungatella hominis]MBC5706593.1 GntR family transcriptional regulator [Hungatella hominis]